VCSAIRPFLSIDLAAATPGRVALSLQGRKAHLNRDKQQEAQDRSSVTVQVIHEAIRKQGDEELNRPMQALAWSGLAVGFSMGMSLVFEGLLQAHLPNTPWRSLIVHLGYPFGFLMVIGGRQQLFTENTLSPILPLLERRDRATLWKVVKLWIAVLVANLTGGAHCGMGPEQYADIQAGCAARVSRNRARGDRGRFFDRHPAWHLCRLADRDDGLDSRRVEQCSAPGHPHHDLHSRLGGLYPHRCGLRRGALSCLERLYLMAGRSREDTRSPRSSATCSAAWLWCPR